jgi:hypothetical protein
MRKITQIQKLQEVLGKLNVGEQINKHEYVKANWHTFDYFTKRSFDVVLCRAKKLFVDKEFDSHLKYIIRTK